MDTFTGWKAADRECTVENSAMIRSMTAFARREAGSAWGVMTWELRSVNHRYLEIGLRLPDALRGLEPVVRERISSRVGRGKVDGALRYAPSGDALATIALNQPLAARDYSVI